jgi:hypothetical protein
MKAERIELAALAAAVPAARSRLETDTYVFLADFTEACRKVAETPEDVRQERIQAVRDALVRPADAEAVRAAFWLRAPLPARMVALMAAGLPKARAEDALSTFTAFERGSVWVALNRLLGELQMIQKCMNGGNSTPPGATTPDRKKVMNGYPAEAVH